MTRIRSWTTAFDFSEALNHVYEALLRCNAFEEDLKNYKLIFPESKPA